MLSDTLNKEIIIPNFVESTALGAYKMACVGSKISLEGPKVIFNNQPQIKKGLLLWILSIKTGKRT